MPIAIVSVLLACLCWGLIFVLPSYICGFNPVEIALGRFFFYGLISIVWLLINKRYLLSRLYSEAWKKAAWLGLISTIVCYSGMVFSMRYANPAVTALIYAMSPITIALVGNYRKKEFSFRQLFIPSILMMSGIVLANLSAFQYSSESLGLYILGLSCGILGLTSWTWYTVDNSHFLHRNNLKNRDFDKEVPQNSCPERAAIAGRQDASEGKSFEVKPTRSKTDSSGCFGVSRQPQIAISDWSLMMGSATFILVLIIGSFFVLLLQDPSKFFVFQPEMQTFLIISAVMGVVSTWLAFFFWNFGAKKLPISLAGQLMIFEVIFGLVFIYFVEKRFPPLMEALGIAVMLMGVLGGCRTLTKRSLAKANDNLLV